MALARQDFLAVAVQIGKGTRGHFLAVMQRAVEEMNLILPPPPDPANEICVCGDPRKQHLNSVGHCTGRPHEGAGFGYCQCIGFNLGIVKATTWEPSDVKDRRDNRDPLSEELTQHTQVMVSEARMMIDNRDAKPLDTIEIGHSIVTKPKKKAKKK